MSQVNPSPNNPRSGRLITTDDLDRIGLDLQTMLNLTSNHALHCSDAWADGNTDTAFACNNFVGVQRSSADNDYNFGWVNFTNERGTYLYIPGDAYLMEQTTQPVTEVSEVKTVPISNNTPEPLTVNETYVEKTASWTKILNAPPAPLALHTEFKMSGLTFELEGSLQQGNEAGKTKATTHDSTVTIQIVAPPMSSSHIRFMTVTTRQRVVYGLDLIIGSDNPDGSIGKATRNQSVWDRWFRWEDIVPDHTKQVVRFKVEESHTETHVEVLRGSSKQSEHSGEQQAEAKIVSKTRSD